MEIKHLQIGSRIFSYSLVFFSPTELSVSFYEGVEKRKTVLAKILSYDAGTGFLAFDLEGRVFRMVVTHHHRVIEVQSRDAARPIICKKIHALQAGSPLSFSPEGMSCDREQDLVSPLSGRVVQIFVKNGDLVKKGSSLLVVESMKMENVIYASRDAVIKNVFIGIGDLVKQNQKLIGFKRAGEVYGACQAASEF